MTHTNLSPVPAFDSRPVSHFYFGNHAVRVELDGATPWFNANDLCGVLGYVNPHDALAKHVDTDDLAKREVIDSMGRTQLSNFVNESGMYALVLGSRTEAAKRVKRWVTSEVLPAIRQTGSYGAPSPEALAEAYAKGHSDALQGVQHLLPEHLKKISRYHNMGLQTAEIALLMRRDRSTVRRHKRRLRSAGVISDVAMVDVVAVPALWQAMVN